MKVIAITNQKGGVGKTSTAHALGAGLQKRGYKTLYIDLDPQCNLSYTLKTGEGTTSFGVLTGEAAADAAIQTTATGDNVIPADEQLAAADVTITAIGKEYRLSKALKGLQGYDFVILDTPPAIGVIAANALTAADTVIIPAQAGIYTLQGIGQLSRTIEAIREYTNPNLQIGGILLTRHKSRARLARDIAAALDHAAETIGTKVYKSIIRECISVGEAQAMQQNIFDYAPKSNAAADYGEFIEEFLNDLGKQ